jgi:hypothetical protein
VGVPENNIWVDNEMVLYQVFIPMLSYCLFIKEKEMKSQNIFADLIKKFNLK